MKIFYLLLFCSFSLTAQNINFADPDLRAALLAHSPVIDTNNNGQITFAEAAVVLVLNLDSKDINSFTEIQFFSNLESLRLRANPITTLDISQNSKLETFTLRTCNDLSSINLRDNHFYTSINLAYCNLSSFSIGDNSSVIDIIDLQGNPITSVSFGNIPEVIYLKLDNMQLSSFDIGDIQSFTTLELDNNKMGSVSLCGLKGAGRGATMDITNQSGPPFSKLYTIDPALRITVFQDGDYNVREDGDCDGVPTSIDCDDSDPSNTNTNTNDNDCDGVPNAEDCEPNDPKITTSNVNDGDCDGVSTAIDCDDNDASVTTTNVDDNDCDGVPNSTDCDPNDPNVTTSNVNDADCDGVPTAIDCNDNDASVTTANVDDNDCDGVPNSTDCDPNDPNITTTMTNDNDCDGVINSIDNCIDTFNPGQEDSNSNNVGDACESTAPVPSLENSTLSAPDAFGTITGDPGTLKIIIADDNNDPIPNVRVQFVLLSGSATIVSAFGTTNTSGIYQTNVNSTVVGNVTFKARFDSDDNNSVDKDIIEGSPTIIRFDMTAGASSGGGAVGINTSNPDPSSVLDIVASDKGVLFPRVSLLSSSDRVTIVEPTIGLLVYNINNTQSLPSGFVYFDGSKWNSLTCNHN